MTKVTVVLGLALALTGCGSTGVLSAITSAISPDKPEITAQVGAENSKQGIGVNSKVEQTEKTSVGDVSGSAKVKQSVTKKAQQVETGSITATNMNVTTSNPYPLLLSFALGLLAVLGVVMWFVPTPKQLLARRAEHDE